MNRQDEIKSNLKIVQDRISIACKSAGRGLEEIKLIAVTKTFAVEDLKILYSLGIRDFGENRDQEASKKSVEMPKDINWHFQGQIQSNKLKSITSWATYIHSVDQYRYAKLISEFAGDQHRSIFLQVSLDQVPESRGGVDPVRLHDLAAQISQFSNLNLMGLMAVAPLNENTESSFARLSTYQHEFVQSFPEAKFLSAGMSGDYE